MRKVRWNGQVHEIPTRDTQRQKVYNAEREAFPDHFRQQLPADNDLFQLIVDGITESHFWNGLAIRGGRSPRPVRVCRNSRSQRGWATGSLIHLPKRYRSVSYLLHELAHCATQGLHHFPFCATYLELVREFMGERHYGNLLYQFEEYGVKYTP